MSERCRKLSKSRQHQFQSWLTISETRMITHTHRHIHIQTQFALCRARAQFSSCSLSGSAALSLPSGLPLPPLSPFSFSLRDRGHLLSPRVPPSNARLHLRRGIGRLLRRFILRADGRLRRDDDALRSRYKLIPSQIPGAVCVKAGEGLAKETKFKRAALSTYSNFGLSRGNRQGRGRKFES